MRTQMIGRAFSVVGPLVSLEELERRYILYVIKMAGDNRSAAARVLRLNRKTLYARLAKYKRPYAGEEY